MIQGGDFVKGDGTGTDGCWVLKKGTTGGYQDAGVGKCPILGI